ncbi:Aminodeoxychorismate synthase [Mycena sanguinolenta]|uniref:Aminodeoxychorismate synthase n=1 Tax=Mycena sanguinolenta TaxID=230812 RepID=A0A8H6Y031_9AGAR|nr:Aminodeoxychorismate synthase [Mycena sanguinolenta]
MTKYTEHTVKLPDGIELFYTDSGPLDSASYTTLVVLHGSAFTGDGMVPLHRFAHQNDLRVILLNRRDYPGSTKYTDAELEDLKAGRRIFQDRLAIQLAWFLEHFIDHENTPKLSADRNFGNATALSLFSNPDAIPKPLYQTIEPYLMSLVLYDPPHIALGYVLPGQDSVYDPWTDPDYPTPEAVYDNFKHWVSSYYKHPDIASGKPSGMSFEKRTERRTYTTWNDEQRAKYFNTTAAVRTELPAYAPPMQAILKTQTHDALFNADLVSSYFPNVEVFHISGTETCYFCMWGYMESLRLYNEALARGDKVRPTKFKLVEGANHFLHYDMPDCLLKEVVQSCKEL